jgi:anti-sigma factor RsiW
MSTQHATSAELELYVLGALETAHAEKVEAHCAACDRCAAALAGEARLETAFEQVAARSVRPPVARPLRAAGYGVVGLVAMAATFLIWFGHVPGPSPAVEGTPAAALHPMDDGPSPILDARNDSLDGGSGRRATD